MSVFRRLLLLGLMNTCEENVVSGTSPISVENAKARNIIDVTVKGKSVQSGDASLEYPAETVDTGTFCENTGKYEMRVTIKNEKRISEYKIEVNAPLRSILTVCDSFTTSTGKFQRKINEFALSKDVTVEKVNFDGEIKRFSINLSNNGLTNASTGKLTDGGYIMSNCFARIPKSNSESFEGVKLTSKNIIEIHVDENRIGGSGLNDEEYISNFKALAEEKGVWFRYAMSKYENTDGEILKMFADEKEFTLWAEDYSGNQADVTVDYYCIA